MNNARILIVDDEPDIRDICESIIKRSFDFEISKAANLSDAEKLYRANLADIVLLDLNLPDGVGFDLLTKIKAINDETEVLIITAYSQEKERNKAKELGAYDLLGKPFRSIELKEIVNQIIENKGITHVRK